MEMRIESDQFISIPKTVHIVRSMRKAHSWKNTQCWHKQANAQHSIENMVIFTVANIFVPVLRFLYRFETQAWDVNFGWTTTVTEMSNKTRTGNFFPSREYIDRDTLKPL